MDNLKGLLSVKSNTRKQLPPLKLGIDPSSHQPAAKLPPISKSVAKETTDTSLFNTQAVPPINSPAAETHQQSESQVSNDQHHAQQRNGTKQHLQDRDVSDRNIFQTSTSVSAQNQHVVVHRSTNHADQAGARFSTL